MKKLLLILMVFSFVLACSDDKEEETKPTTEDFNPVLGKWENIESKIAIEFTWDFKYKTHLGSSFNYTITKTHIKYLSNEEPRPYKIYEKDGKTYLEFHGNIYVKVE